LQLIHSEIYGPLPVTSHGGICYFIFFIDDFLRKIWVYFLKEKSEAFQIFKDFKAGVENKTGLKIQTLKTDHGGEYLSNNFERYCKDHGIKRQQTARYISQKNGVFERRNCTIMDMVI